MLGGLLLLGYQIAPLFHLSGALHTRARKWGIKYSWAIRAPSLLRHFRHQQGSRKVTHPVRLQAIFWDCASQVGGTVHVSSSSFRTLQRLSILWIRDASIRYSVSVSAPIRSFSADRVSERRDRSKSDIVCILFCVIVKPHEITKAL